MDSSLKVRDLTTILGTVSYST